MAPRSLRPLADCPHGETGLLPPDVFPSPPPCGWSTGFIATPLVWGLLPLHLFLPALPILIFFWSGIEYDPNRTAHIALISYKDNEKSYIICPQGLKKGDVIESGKDVDIKIGNTLELRDIPPGTSIHNVELIPGNGAKLARSAGSSVTLSGYDEDYAILKLSSGETRKVSNMCLATIGTVSNPDQKNIKIGKAEEIDGEVKDSNKRCSDESSGSPTRRRWR